MPKMINIHVLIPVYDDWESSIQLLKLIDDELSHYAKDICIRITIVNDGGGKKKFTDDDLDLKNIAGIEIVHLLKNMGHQRAIAIGLCHLQESKDFDAVLVMDGDGEDTPEGVLALIDKYVECKGEYSVFAKRKKRKENFGFKFYYKIYQILHRILTGYAIEVGNFSIVPSQHISQLTVGAELWNHYAASVVIFKIPRKLIPIDRGVRLQGQSKMNFISLAIHGMSAISVYNEKIVVRLLTFGVVLLVALMAALLTILGIKFFTELAITGWATNAFGLTLLLLLNFITFLLIISISTLNERSKMNVLPIQNYHFFIAAKEDLGCGKR
tara:strand:- start:1062 stop:2042 length:981 start_codon:yes stop_codon:yes gene_type:complete